MFQQGISSTKAMIAILILTVLVGAFCYWQYLESDREFSNLGFNNLRIDFRSSRPKECVTGKGTILISKALDLMQKSECAEKGTLENNYVCNENTGTLWVDLEPFEEKAGCNPACVLNIETGEMEINWRCTGLLPQ